jgi:hypothetical protein
MNQLPIMISVVGHHRGGTSATAGLLRLFGVYLGENTQLIGEGTDNPKGFFEHLKILQIHEHLSRHVFGNDWDDNKEAPAPQEHDQVGQACRYLIAELLQMRQKQLWMNAVKDPRMSRFLKLWERAAKETEFVLAPLVIRRDLKAVIESLKSREKVPPQWTEEQYWHFARTNDEMLDIWARHPNAHEVRYPDLLDWRNNLWPIVQKISLDHDITPGKLQEMQVKLADEFVEPELCHHG